MDSDYFTDTHDAYPIYHRSWFFQVSSVGVQDEDIQYVFADLHMNRSSILL